MPKFDRAQFDLFRHACAGAPLCSFPLGPRGLPAGKWGRLGVGKSVEPSLLHGAGIATGARSGGLLCIDVDVKAGRDGFASLRTLPPLPPTLRVDSPSGGAHLYFRDPGDWQSNAGKIAPGIDVRAEGGFVRAPGTPHPKLEAPYTVAAPTLPPSALPEAWRALLTPHVPLPVEPSSPDLESPTAAELRTRLEATCFNKRGEIWPHWRAILSGERFLRLDGLDLGPERPAQYGGVDDFIVQGLFQALALEREQGWHTVSGAAIAALVEPSFSILRADVERLGGVSKYSPAVIADKWNRVAEFARRTEIQAERAKDLLAALRGSAAPPPDPNPEGDELPAIVVYRGQYYVRDLEGQYVGPVMRAGLWVTCRHEWRGAALDGHDLGVYLPSKQGPRPMRVDELVEHYGYPCSHVDHRLSSSRPRLEGRALELPGPIIRAEPKRHPEIERWLEAYDPEGWLHRWIAIVTDLDFAAPALWLTGSGGIGKSLLARGLAGIWGSTPTEIAEAMAEFNAHVLKSPIIHGEEDIPRGGFGRPDVEALKRLITATGRQVNAKHEPLREVYGAARVILSSNNTNMIRLAHDLTAADADALSDRFVHIHVEGEHARAVKASLPARGRIQKHWLDGGMLAEHALWLRDTLEVPHGPRLRMEARAGRLRSMFLTQSSAGFLCCMVVYIWITSAARAKEGGAPVAEDSRPIRWAHGTVCATSAAVYDLFPPDEKRYNRRSVGKALKNISSRYTSIKIEGRSVKVHVIDLEHVRVWCEEENHGDLEELDRACAILNEGSDNHG